LPPRLDAQLLLESINKLCCTVYPPGNGLQLPVQRFMLAVLDSLVGNAGSKLMLSKNQGAKSSNLISDGAVLLSRAENEIA